MDRRSWPDAHADVPTRSCETCADDARAVAATSVATTAIARTRAAARATCGRFAHRWTGGQLATNHTERVTQLLPLEREPRRSHRRRAITDLRLYELDQLDEFRNRVHAQERRNQW